MSQCTNCGTELVEGSASCPFCGSAQIVQSQEPVPQFQDLAMEQQEFVPQTTEDKPKKKSKKRLLIILSSVVSIAAILVVVGLLTNWFGLVSPIQGLINATVNTFDAKNMTIQYSLEEEYNFDDYEHEYVEEYDILLNFDREKGDVAYLTEDEFRIRFLDNGESGYYRKDSEYGDIYVDEDAEERIDDLQDAIGGDEVDWEKLTETFDLEDYIKADGMNAFFKKLYKECLCDKNWLKENLGFKKTDDTYEFVFDADRLEKFLEEVLRLSDETDALTRDAERAIKQAVRDIKRDADETAKITFSFTVKDKKLEKIQVVEKGEYYKRAMTLEFSKIGKTDVYEAIDDARDKIESASCTVCGSYGYMYTKNGRKYCWRCYKDRYYDYDYYY